jgi:hypothetical protein
MSTCGFVVPHPTPVTTPDDSLGQSWRAECLEHEFYGESRESQDAAATDLEQHRAEQ